MLLFDIIRDWFVMYIWGGSASNGDIFNVYIGNGVLFDTNEGSSDVFGSGTDLWFDISKTGDGFISQLCLSDWLSTISTIIVMVLLCVVFGLMVRWLFRLTAGLLRGN